MFGDLFRIPDTFEADDRRRRQVVNIIVITFSILGVLGTVLSVWIIDYHVDPYGSASEQNILMVIMLVLIMNVVLLLANRSPRVPGWLSGAMLVVVFFVLTARADAPLQLYNGRSLLAWVFAMLLSALVLPPATVFLVATGIFGMMVMYTPPAAGGVNYYAAIEFFAIAVMVWLGMSIANRAIRDARRQAANLEAIFNSVAEGVLVLDLQGRLFSANPALLEMISRADLQEIITRPLGKTVQWKRKVYSVTVSAVPEVGSVAVFRDETRRYETERARDALIATASHELRTPLAAVMNYLELLAIMVKSGRVNAGEFSEHLGRAFENTKRLQQLVDNILDQAQIQAGAFEFSSQPYDLRLLLEKTRQLLEGLISKKKLTYEVNVEADVPREIMGDAQRLQQVLVNLIGNAIKFTEQGGIKVHVSAPNADQLRIEVADSGEGIPPEQLPDIFEAFRRGSNYAQREHQGAGLGLSIVKEIITRMGGEIAVTSDPGLGTTFRVTLPCLAV